MRWSQDRCCITWSSSLWFDFNTVFVLVLELNCVFMTQDRPDQFKCLNLILLLLLQCPSFGARAQRNVTIPRKCLGRRKSEGPGLGQRVIDIDESWIMSQHCHWVSWHIHEQDDLFIYCTLYTVYCILYTTSMSMSTLFCLDSRLTLILILSRF